MSTIVTLASTSAEAEIGAAAASAASAVFQLTIATSIAGGEASGLIVGATIAFPATCKTSKA